MQTKNKIVVKKLNKHFSALKENLSQATLSKKAYKQLQKEKYYFL